MDEIPIAPARRLGLRRTGVALAVGVGLTLGAAGIAAAATSPSPSPKSGSPTPARGPRPDHLRGPGGGPGLGLLGALHGTLVVPDGAGTKTIDVQRGAVTAVSATSLTVQSRDQVTKTYVLNARTIVDGGRDTVGSIAKDDEVLVVADADGTATRVRDLTKLRAERRTWGRDGGRGRRGPDGPPGAPAPGATPGSWDRGNGVGDGQPA
jgi:hypothetical protein